MNYLDSLGYSDLVTWELMEYKSIIIKAEEILH